MIDSQLTTLYSNIRLAKGAPKIKLDSAKLILFLYNFFCANNYNTNEI